MGHEVHNKSCCRGHGGHTEENVRYNSLVLSWCVCILASKVGFTVSLIPNIIPASKKVERFTTSAADVGPH